jgi:hypothetical protein
MLILSLGFRHALDAAGFDWWEQVETQSAVYDVVTFIGYTSCIEKPA